MPSSSPRRGEIWIVDTPGRPEDPHQPRPGIVISEDVRNEYRDHAIVVPFYSEGTVGPTHVGIRAGTGGLEHDSVIFCEKISTVDYQFFHDGPLGLPVPESILRGIVLAVRLALGDETLILSS